MNNENIYIFEQEYIGPGGGDTTYFPSGEIEGIKKNDILTFHAINTDYNKCSYLGIISIYKADESGTLKIQQNNKGIVIKDTIIKKNFDNWEGSFAVIAPKHSSLINYKLTSENQL